MGTVGAIHREGDTASCDVVLDSGERLRIRHNGEGRRLGLGGLLTVQVLRLWGLAVGELLLECHLDREEHRQVLGHLLRGGPHPSHRVTAVSAVADYLKDARSVAEARLRCMGLTLAPVTDAPRGLGYAVGFLVGLVVALLVVFLILRGRP